MGQQQKAISVLDELNAESNALLLSLANLYQYQLKDFSQAISCLQLYLASYDSPQVRARLAELKTQPVP